MSIVWTLHWSRQCSFITLLPFYLPLYCQSFTDTENPLLVLQIEGSLLLNAYQGITLELEGHEAKEKGDTAEQGTRTLHTVRLQHGSDPAFLSSLGLIHPSPDSCTNIVHDKPWHCLPAQSVTDGRVAAAEGSCIID